MYAPSPANVAQQFQPVAEQNISVTGWDPYFANAIKATVVTISALPCIVGPIALINTDGAPVFLQFFDLPANVPITVGTTTPTFPFPYPSNATAANGVADRFVINAQFKNFARCAATTTATGSGASTNGLTGYIGYKNT